MTVAEELVDWALALRPGDLPDSAADAALRHLLDGVGNAIASLHGHAVDPALIVATGLGGDEATILGTTQRVGAPAAALANGALVHGLDFDDTHAGGLVHATAVVLPAALAVGEIRGGLPDCDGHAAWVPRPWPARHPRHRHAGLGAGDRTAARPGCPDRGGRVGDRR
jgi:2-methylcitrate dehydratase PrpD